MVGINYNEVGELFLDDLEYSQIMKLVPNASKFENC